MRTYRQFIVEKTQDSLAFEVDKEEFVITGTPEQLKKVREKLGKEFKEIEPSPKATKISADDWLKIA